MVCVSTIWEVRGMACRGSTIPGVRGRWSVVQQFHLHELPLSAGVARSAIVFPFFSKARVDEKFKYIQVTCEGVGGCWCGCSWLGAVTGLLEGWLRCKQCIVCIIGNHPSPHYLGL